MKNVNILSIIEAYRNLSSALFTKLLDSYGIVSAIKDYELEGLEALVDGLLKTKDEFSIVDNYYLGYSIPQIGKEFDLLRFGNDCIVNIEIKTRSSPDKILRQQEKNRYYLSFLGKSLHIYTYISDENKLYKLEDGLDEVKVVDFGDLCGILLSQDVVTFNDIDGKFNPSDYLVSPFNSTDKFMSGGYFLTVQQEHIYNKIRHELSESSSRFVALTGGAGTGKTLLTYHIVKFFLNEGKRVLILHCAPLNNGHRILVDKYGWEIHMTRYAPSISDYDLIVIDEAQRMYPYQFDTFVDKIRSYNKKCIFSYDENQYLSDNEKRYHLSERLEHELSCIPYKLTGKIRINKEVACFIKQLFDLKLNIREMVYPNITLTYCKDFKSARNLFKVLSARNWKIPNYTPGTRSTFSYQKYSSDDVDSAHSVIGQEFDNVVVVIDGKFKYNSQGRLVADNTYYSQRQMLYQIITRTRKKLYIVIINNETMLNRCIDILYP